MIEVKYIGQLGNNLFQYCLGRILAENLGFKLKAGPIAGFPNTRVQIGGYDYSEYPPYILGEQRIDLKSILCDRPKRKIVLEGYFQRYEYYKEYKDIIKGDWLLTDIKVKKGIGANDIVVCIRRGDYLPKHALAVSYYEEALRLADYDRVFVCTDCPSDPFIFRFGRKYKAVVRSTNALDDFAFIMGFDKIIISRSTFHWWAAFLSKAREIYFPIPLTGRWSKEQDAELKVDDEDRYIYLQCKEEYKISYADRLILLKKKAVKCLKYKPRGCLLTRRGNDNRSLLFFTVHKADSMFIYDIAQRLSGLGGFSYYSINKGNLDEADPGSWSDKGRCYAPLRSLLPSIDPLILKDYNIILHLRDPRDVLTSLFFSDAYSHARNRMGFNPSDKERRAWIEGGIDKFILKKADNNKSHAEVFLSRYRLYCQHLLGRPNVTFVKYEEMVTDFRSWLSKVMVPFNINNEEKITERLVRKNNNNFRVVSENVLKHKRKVTPGDYKQKLKPGTIEELNLMFKDVLQKLDYEI